jgi:hypothetical protein
VSLEGQWRRIHAQLPEDWADAQLALEVPNAAQRARAAALLGPANPGRFGSELRFAAHRRGAGTGAEAVRRLLGRLDGRMIKGRLRLVEATEIPAETEIDRAGLAPAWDAAVAALPPDWSDLLCELELESSDWLPRAALLCAPLNPTRSRDTIGFVFRCARRAGYGASPGMARRCLQRLDEEAITGGVRVLRALSDSRLVATQGPVWYVGGRDL